MDSPTIERIFRNEAGRALATLIRLVGDFELAEEALQEAFAIALQRWPANGVPDNPRAWLVRTGRNKAIDHIRRRINLRAKLATLDVEEASAADDAEPQAIDDDLLRLIFTCCHPALAPEARVALTLRTLCGLETSAVARAFLVSEETMAQRLVRAKSKIRDARIPYVVPERDTLDERLDAVLATIYLVFTEGYSASSGDELLRAGLCEEAIRLGRLLVQLLPDRANAEGLLALMLLHHARRLGRTGPDGDIILLEGQDRSLWDQGLIEEGRLWVEKALRVPARPGAYAIQAAIAALHASAARFEDTDWRQIAGLYDILQRLYPSPVVELNRAAAIAMVDGPKPALDLIDALAARGELPLYAPLAAARAELLTRLGRVVEARDALRLALTQSRLAPERKHLARRLADLGEASGRAD